MIGYADGGRMARGLRHARGRHSTATPGSPCFTDDAEYHEDPFGSPLVGHNALRAFLLDAAASQRDVEFTVEQHWVSGTTVLAAWHASFARRSTGRIVRLAGFLTAEVAPTGG